jgi:hypothetical protein
VDFNIHINALHILVGWGCVKTYSFLRREPRGEKEREIMPCIMVTLIVGLLEQAVPSKSYVVIDHDSGLVKSKEWAQSFSNLHIFGWLHSFMYLQKPILHLFLRPSGLGFKLI